MLSEIATESVVRQMVTEIKKELEESRGKPEVCSALKKIGRFALTLFEWDTPEWAKGCEELFKE